MSEIVRCALWGLARLFGPPRPRRRPARKLELPAWAEVRSRRHAHIRCVAALVEQWAEELGVSRDERRRGRRKERARLARRVPRDRDAVLREVVARQIDGRLRAESPIHRLTVEFWNSLAPKE